MTVIPLYNGSEIKEILSERPSMANTGLWYDKFCNQWTEDWDPIGDRKKDWIETVTNGKIGNSDEIDIINNRMKKLIESFSGKFLLFINESRFVTGLGKNHPVENGFTWHHSLGVPYIPGTSVKGIVRDWARQNGVDKPKIHRLFGPDDNSERSVGLIIFLDALPAKPVSLSADIMTPHYGPYYSNQKIPGDWHDPTPIPFLTVDKDQEFLFGILPKGDVSEEEIDEVEKWLIEALEWSGVGAKTNIGYGRFAHIEVKSPAEQWIINLSKEQKVEESELVTKCPRIVRDKLNIIDDMNLRSMISKRLKTHFSSELWSRGGFGEGKRLISDLKKYIGE